ncbi:MAG: flavodoxin family protein [Actinobacteria bacterium]|jgi:hypothetical protein|nr:MAG: flavodoxin family protein [Actinomycetota bacterium]
MKILAFNCSPRMKKSNTDRILIPLLRGAGEAGAEVEKIYARKLDLKPCLGCFNCWLKTPGLCTQKDDWGLVLGKMAEADLIVYATPVYAYNMTVYMRTLFDRTGMLVIHPYFTTTDNGLVHLCRYPGIRKKAVLVANALLWDESVFSLLADGLEAISTRVVDEEGRPIMEMAGKILVGCGEILDWVETPQHALQPFYEALESAGAELVRDGGLSAASEERLSVPLWTYLGIKDGEAKDFLNEHFRRILEQDPDGIAPGN